MLVALSVRKLKPGAYEDFRRAWEPERFPSGLTRAYHARAVGDPDQVVSFGLLDGDPDAMDEVRTELGDIEERRQQAMAQFVEEVIVDTVYEVVDEVVPPRA